MIGSLTYLYWYIQINLFFYVFQFFHHRCIPLYFAKLILAWRRNMWEVCCYLIVYCWIQPFIKSFVVRRTVVLDCSIVVALLYSTVQSREKIVFFEIHISLDGRVKIKFRMLWFRDQRVLIVILMLLSCYWISCLTCIFNGHEKDILE